MNNILEKSQVKNLLKEAAKEWNVYVPQTYVGSDILIDKLPKKAGQLKKALKNICLDNSDTLIPPKDIFFPQLETMFEFKKGKVKETVESSAKLLWGVKPCDLAGILFVDDFFKRNFEDVYYLSRVANRFIVAIGCLKPPRPNECFCSSTNTGPFADKGFDLQLIDTGEFCIVEIGSKKGEEFIAKYAEFFKNSGVDYAKAAEQIKSRAASNIQVKVDFQKALDLMKKDDFVLQENYKRIGERCIYCGACLYVCPTCTCFNVFDDEKCRSRTWDGCVFEGYTRETSGHNPRKDKWLRTSRRYEHKLKYDYKATGTSGCVGCGRCLSSCPVNIGIAKFIREITEGEKIL